MLLSCDILNAGTVESYLSTVVRWLRQHPYEVVTIIIGNGDFLPIADFVDPVEKSGLKSLAYIPPKNTETKIKYHQWPTLSQMILSGFSS
jgi:hypothetical protein